MHGGFIQDALLGEKKRDDGTALEEKKEKEEKNERGGQGKWRGDDFLFLRCAKARKGMRMQRVSFVLRYGAMKDHGIAVIGRSQWRRQKEKANEFSQSPLRMLW